MVKGVVHANNLCLSKEQSYWSDMVFRPVLLLLSLSYSILMWVLLIELHFVNRQAWWLLPESMYIGQVLQQEQGT